MNQLLKAVVGVFSLLIVSGGAAAQERSVRPGINDSFRDPDVDEFVKRFEIESREVFVLRNEIVAACRIEPGMTVADIGAGTGLFTRLFAEAAGESGRVVAVDIAQKFLDHIAESSREAGLKNVETVLCSADATGLPPESVDVAFICDTYHHFEFPLKTMQSLRAALKPNGRVIVVDFRKVAGVSSDFVMGHVRAPQAVFESEIVQAGFLKSRDETELLKENYFVEFTASAMPGLQPLVYPVIAGYGGVVATPKTAVEPPRAGASVVFNVTAGDAPSGVNRGLERAALLLNLYGAAGRKASDVQLTVVLHGEATKAVLASEFYAARFQTESNPNLPLLESLYASGVQVLVCGQSLNRQGFPETAIAPNVKLSASALTAVINRQANGYSVIEVE
ncbi:MAG: methyltransferase domain-containing protein [Planctomycetaceae bacterium]|nr:methyltransferase domain-containing protein [Planctomycetaceae bacterium]